MDHARLAATFRKLALDAGREIMEVYGRPDFDVAAKADASPVTEADLRADRVICEGLAAAFPEIPVVTEEQQASHGIAADVFILVDPLDGTKEFVQRRGDFTVNIALIEHGVATRGVVYAPAKARLFYTDAQGQAVEEAGPHDAGRIGAVTPLHVSEPDPEALVVVASKSHRDQATDDYIALYRVADFRSAGSSLKFCLVAAGEADLYPRLGRTMEWDTAAGHAVLSGAGGRVVRFDGHAPLTYGKEGFENPQFIAFAPGLTLLRA
ncbi:MAG TPA: 3'(2'),5'-bisphosphate nucleotidase CysQ [Amaricoccus sp.]|uniref:3'(2'),5'-bisphosphate nucleotidase CysQ n=1 Tax=Amaricoccus sp. TaxID=1872485 RepID=UPI002BA7A0F4|nr:3'(2'),5'-bisphosphate nucleotidase CysQ [Amaricoccus sp.]HMQ91558.1 3'(2'),5'-bisphosphate nucleotidase CysQ [Amaricoccus sp.]HMR50977.1 3'(2'),5'-bisphosphate nucleotidase CysQ [Amaricoccus sp.]HMR59831.1 3'(2'),5'-bisphosphate nucleotidase CysQ [Amaricoccus sp.]HMT97844.1 3'(2'),5'-bisphosphate nucleotidase CysQ [Amaricoccus sp.]